MTRELVALTLVQACCLLALRRPAQRLCRGRAAGTSLATGYWLAVVLALAISYGLDMLGGFTARRAFWVWAATCLAANCVPGLRSAHSASRPGRMDRRVAACGALTLVVTLAIRLRPPLSNVALAGTDSYQFVNFVSAMSVHNEAILDYPAGVALLAALAPWRVAPYEAVRWLPTLLWIGGLCASFGLWRKLGGARFALWTAWLLGTAWFLYPITAYHPHFIQWTTVFLGLPSLAVAYSVLRSGGGAGWAPAWGVLVSAGFAMTSGYFALVLNTMFLLVFWASLPWRRDAVAPALRAALVALAAPATLLLYYGVLVRHFFVRYPAGVAEQARHVIAASEGVGQPATAAGAATAWVALADLVRTFLAPTWPPAITARWLVYVPLLGLSGWLWWRWRAPRMTGLRLLAGVSAWSTLSAMTGICELPAWEGRSVFLALFTGLLLALWSLLEATPRRLRRLFRRPAVVALGCVFTAGPALLRPPAIGRNVPVSAAIHPRSIPGDNLLMAELTRPPPDGSARRTALLVVSDEDVGLLRNLRRLDQPTRAVALAGYRLVREQEVDARTGRLDAVVIPAGRFESEGWADGFTVHVQGDGVVLGLRRSPDHTP